MYWPILTRSNNKHNTRKAQNMCEDSKDVLKQVFIEYKFILFVKICLKEYRPRSSQMHFDSVIVYIFNELLSAGWISTVNRYRYSSQPNVSTLGRCCATLPLSPPPKTPRNHTNLIGEQN